MPNPTSIPALPASQGTDASATLEGLVQSIPILENAEDPTNYLNEPLLTPLQISILAVLFLAILTGVLWWVRRRPKQAIAPETPAQIALSKLKALQQASLNPRESSIETSLCLREFITGKSLDPALFETQQEFNLRDSSLESIPADFRDPTRNLLDKLARLKYAPDTSTDTETIQAMIAEAEKLVGEIDIALHIQQIQDKKEGETQNGQS